MQVKKTIQNGSKALTQNEIKARALARWKDLAERARLAYEAGDKAKVNSVNTMARQLLAKHPWLNRDVTVSKVKRHVRIVGEKRVKKIEAVQETARSMIADSGVAGVVVTERDWEMELDSMDRENARLREELASADRLIASYKRMMDVIKAAMQ